MQGVPVCLQQQPGVLPSETGKPLKAATAFRPSGQHTAAGISALALIGTLSQSPPAVIQCHKESVTRFLAIVKT